MSSLKLYRHPLSGHSHRVEVFLSLLKLNAQIIDIDLMAGAHKQPAFIAKNSFAQIPVLEDNNIFISDSNAIILYLAKKYDASRSWYPESIIEQAQIQQFLSVAAGQIAYGPAKARLVNIFAIKADLQSLISASHEIITKLNNHLANRNWLVTEQPTIADVANYTYIAHATEGGVSLAEYPHIQAWIIRFESLPGFIGMKKTKI